MRSMRGTQPTIAGFENREEEHKSRNVVGHPYSFKICMEAMICKLHIVLC